MYVLQYILTFPDPRSMHLTKNEVVNDRQQNLGR